jgi:hypothetical protein
MITISTNERIKKGYFNDSFSNQINFVDEAADSDLYFKVVRWDDCFRTEVRPNQISFLQAVRTATRRASVREGYGVDNRITPRPNFKSFHFAQHDLCDIPYIIPAPWGPRFGDNKTIKNETFNNKVLWCGNLTHSTRREFWNSFYSKISDKRFDISLFGENVYRDGFKPGTYEAFLDTLSKSDIVYLLRGDRIWAHTFYDIIRAGCIPIMISSMNYYGWENIMKNVDDYMLRFDLREHSMEHIHQQVTSLIEDRDRVLYMKANIRKLHDIFFKHNCTSYGFSEFLTAKCVQIYMNCFDIGKIDDKFICEELLELKGLSEKI